VLALYILDDETPGQWCMGSASRWWLHRSLETLGRRIPLILRRGPADAVIAEVLRQSGAASLCFTRGYAPWSAGLERKVNAACQAAGVACHRYGGFLVHEPEAIQTAQGGPYKVFTPFARACFAAGDPKPPRPAPAITWWSGTVPSEALDDFGLLPRRPNWAEGFEAAWQPGEDGARLALARFIDEALADYAQGRDHPGRPATSRLSPHLQFGEISPVQCWQAVRAAQAAAGGTLDRAAETFLKELLWREFSHHLLHLWPQLPEQPFRAEFAGFPWTEDAAGLQAWQRGRTGYPIVDAGMRELWATGYMHNRVRMIAASFLIKHLLIPWQEGERWFWSTLVDADLGNNAASWQWVAGCGADAAPYFRIFNPVLQGEKFDSDGAYVRRWVPELARLPERWLHRPWEAPPAVLASAGVVLGNNYPHPVVDHGWARQRALAAFQQFKGPA